MGSGSTLMQLHLLRVCEPDSDAGALARLPAGNRSLSVDLRRRGGCRGVFSRRWGNRLGRSAAALRSKGLFVADGRYIVRQGTIVPGILAFSRQAGE